MIFTCFSNHLLLELNEQSIAFLGPDVDGCPENDELALLLFADFSISFMLSFLAFDIAGRFRPETLVSVSIAAISVDFRDCISGLSA